MKRYTNYRLGLLIGLFSFNALSACVHTKKELDYWPKLLRCCTTQHSNNNSKIAKVCTAVTVGSLLAPVIYYFYYFGVVEDGFKEWWGADDNGIHYSSNRNRMSCFNISAPSSTSTGWNTTAMPYVNATQADSIIHAIQLAKAKFAINGEPYDGVTSMNSMVLHDQIIKEIRSHDFSPAIIACWLNQGLNIEAKDPNQALINKKDTRGWTLLMYAVWRNNEPAIRFLLNKGANTNTQDDAGNTSLMIALEWNSKPIIDLLIKHKADPCIKNEYGDSPQSYAAFHYNKAKDNKYQFELNEWATIIEKLKETPEKNKTKQCHLAA
ncbi:MAG: ankyrin repeat domain-containing protein [Candidatus Cardinium sp.]|uniref:ankyrin repeat domain-containing protein n=1 Tax=Cardinium endosymbiont of Dermatophagoides farinae TaxID=2597823 RepID=UPI001183B683|nr:ankyrin repeat domain-containing protein [Cardinium endosymbiont of Dermatophagoides farinae]TSJ81318.1 ankyrin repeat domain-containing protein [Cardinium endosymbiont of Dermatophagoides farinae]UWW97382.1 MAG: ankyrin repeat domain-containing protein [Candidatus Cardinium sp.]